MLEDGDVPDRLLPTVLHTANSKAAELHDMVKQLLEGFDPEALDVTGASSPDGRQPTHDGDV
jgi:hypothetical protein